MTSYGRIRGRPWGIAMRGSSVGSVLLAVTLTLTWAGTARAAAFAYVPGSGGDVVSRLNLDSNEALPITVGNAPAGVGGSADGAVVVVTNQSDGTASVIDGTTGTVRWTVPVGSYPRGVTVTPDGAKAFVANTGDQTISVIDTASGLVTRTIAGTGQMGGMATSPSGHRAYVGNASFAGTLLVIDTAADIVLTESVVSATSYVHDAVVSPDGARIYAGVDSAVAIVDAATNLLIDEVPISSACCVMVRGVAVTPDGSRIYAGLAYPGGAVEIDVATHAVTPLPTSSPFSDGGGVAVSPDGSTLYAINTVGTIDLIDVATRTLRATIGALVSFPSATGRFVVGPLPPIVPPAPPVLDGAAQGCQKAVLNSFKSFGAKSHQLLAGCLLRVQKDRAAGGVSSGTVTACSRDLDPSVASSRLAKARALARQRILVGCASAAPAALGRPCDPQATTVGEIADCALDHQLAGVTEIVDGEIAGTCALLDAVGLGGSFPSTCP